MSPGHDSLRGQSLAIEDCSYFDSCWNVFQQCYENIDKNKFISDWKQKTHVIILLDSHGLVKGFSTIELQARNDQAIIFSGDTAIAPEYWADQSLAQTFLKFCAAQLQKNPDTPLYWWLISKGFRTYSLMVRAFADSYPRCDANNGHLKPLLDQLSSERFGNAYDPATEVIRNIEDHEFVKPELVEVNEYKKTPHYNYFIKRNPGHEIGDELSCIARISKNDKLIARYCHAESTENHL